MSMPRLPFSLRQRVSRLRLNVKFSLASLLVTTVAALVASVVLLVFRLQALKTDRMANAVTLAKIVADNVTGAVAFKDAPAATEVLSALKAQPRVTGALVSTPEQIRFAAYGQAPLPEEFLSPDECRFKNWIVFTRMPIKHGQETIGQLYVQTDLNPVLAKTLRQGGTSLLLALLIALAVGFFLVQVLRDFILKPIDALTLAAQLVTKNRDFSIRATVVNADELGELAETFNQMLASLQTSDIALRKANAQLEETLIERTRLEKDLVTASRQAGMAQVATGVLHNVGNVLNSVNISAQIIKQSLSSDPHFPLLQQATQLLREQGAAVGRFLAEDPRGQMMPAFLIELGTEIEALRGNLIKENEQLSQNIEHIKQIVSLQQSHAKSGGINQTVAPSELFAEATRMVASSLDRHGVTFTTTFADMPTITTDRHQVIQILVNFITNAIEAIKQSKTKGKRQIDLQLKRENDEISFTVIDNGIGIPPENREKLFRHGFTTRKDGHGFGLHSGALAAKNLGGQIKVHSDGLGFGAHFTLILPLSRQ